MPKGYIFDIQRYSPKDGDGIRTVVFFKGCPLRCKWCHNPEGYLPQQNYANGSPIGGLKTVDEVMDVILKDLVFYKMSGGGVTLSGGEATAQHEFVTELITECKKYGINVVLETCGYCDSEKFSAIYKLADEIYFDIKLTNEGDFAYFTGGDIELVSANLYNLSKSGIPVVLRCPLIGGVNCNADHYEKIGYIAKTTKNIKRVDLLFYNDLSKDKYAKCGKDYVESFTVPSEEEMEKAKNIIETISGITVKY